MGRVLIAGFGYVGSALGMELVQSGHTGFAIRTLGSGIVRFWEWILMGFTRRILVTSLVLLAACSAERTEDFGLISNRLSPCPSSPNCVSTLGGDAAKSMTPLIFQISSWDVQKEIRKVIEALAGTRIVREEPGYIHVEFTSKVFRFVDDVEFAIDEGTKRIDFRSASRVGYYDFGANRKRMEGICRRLAESDGISRQAT